MVNLSLIIPDNAFSRVCYSNWEYYVWCAWFSAAVPRWRILDLQYDRHIYWYKQVITQIIRMFRCNQTWVDRLIVWTNKDMIYLCIYPEWVMDICVIRWLRIREVTHVEKMILYMILEFASNPWFIVDVPWNLRANGIFTFRSFIMMICASVP